MFLVLERRKAKHHKSRGGCVTCKQRRVKCDESKPECQRCRGVGQICGGYNTPVPWVFESGRPRKRANQLCQPAEKQTLDACRQSEARCLAMYSASRSQMVRPLSTAMNDSPQVLQAFQIYVTLCRAAVEVSEESDLGLFTRSVPQICHQTSVVRWAVSVVSAYAGSMIAPAKQEAYWTFCELQYMRVIRYMASTQAATLNWIESMVTCLLLVVIEAHRNDHPRALIHVKAAVAIFRAHQGSAQASMEVALRRVIERFCLKASRASEAPGAEENMHVDINDVVHQVCQELRGFSSAPAAEKRRMQRHCLQTLDQGLNDVEQTFRSQGRGSDTLRDAYLRVQHATCRLVLMNSHKPRLQMFEGCDESFRTLLKACHHFTEVNYRGHATLAISDGRSVRFGYNLEFILNLFFIASESHNLSTRRSAISALRQYCRRERGWDSLHAAKIAEWLLDEEEAHRNIRSSTGNHTTNQLVLASVRLYREDGGLGSSFRRASWALVEVEKQDGLSQRWVSLEEIAPSSGIVEAQSAPTCTKMRLCYQLDCPVWPSTANMIGQVCLFGNFKRIVA
ncbi:hypothetical protein PV11_03266 [Exophiala sideris]|uniref:Zn(2)-C6 fungal-type domain-containing protein n=1 Tax=Exophiala sideris TaxID=1016849 RepID=A0A0D1XHS9_9EURO|nr:hypothetical protein PV11_03266 [Exophiala sideris]